MNVKTMDDRSRNRRVAVQYGDDENETIEVRRFEQTDDAGAFTDDGPVMHFPYRAITRSQWEAVKRAGDEAWNAYEAKWGGK